MQIDDRSHYSQPKRHVQAGMPESKTSRPRFLGRRFLKEFCDPDHPGAFRFYEGVVFAWEYLPNATPKWQYLLKYTDGDLEHLPSSEVRNLFFVDESDEDTRDVALSSDELTEVDRHGASSSSTSEFCVESSKDRASPKSSQGSEAPEIELQRVIECGSNPETLGLDLKSSSIVDKFFRSLLPQSCGDQSPTQSESKSPSTASTEYEGDIAENSILKGKRKRNIRSLAIVTPLSSARIRGLLSRVQYKFSWQLGEMQIQCELCRRWWKQEGRKGKQSRKKQQFEFCCATRDRKCGVKCLVCDSHLAAREGILLSEGGKEAVLMWASIISEHAKSFPECVLDSRIFASLIAELEDSLPWRAVMELRPEMWRQFRLTCATAVTYARVGTALLWLVRNLKPEAVHLSLLSTFEALVDMLCQVENGSEKLSEMLVPKEIDRIAKSKVENELVKNKSERNRRCEVSALASVMMMFVDQHILNWVGIEALNRRWETSETGWVTSDELEQECNFRYIVRSEVVNRGPWSQQVAAKLRRADDHCDSPVYCKECFGSGRNPEALDEDCSLCLGFGVMHGDSPFKMQLQGGTPAKLRVRFVNEHKGLGVFVEEDIPAGVAVCEYVGELITLQEAQLREKTYAEQGLFYMFEPRQLTSTMTRWVTDATRVGNVARFINHACDPGGNLVVRHFAASGRFGWCDKVMMPSLSCFGLIWYYPLCIACVIAMLPWIGFLCYCPMCY